MSYYFRTQCSTVIGHDPAIAAPKFYLILSCYTSLPLLSNLEVLPFTLSQHLPFTCWAWHSSHLIHRCGLSFPHARSTFTKQVSFGPKKVRQANPHCLQPLKYEIARVVITEGLSHFPTFSYSSNLAAGIMSVWRRHKCFKQSVVPFQTTKYLSQSLSLGERKTESTIST